MAGPLAEPGWPGALFYRFRNFVDVPDFAKKFHFVYLSPIYGLAAPKCVTVDDVTRRSFEHSLLRNPIPDNVVAVFWLRWQMHALR